MAFTWSAALIGLSTLTVSGTVLPFSTSGGRSSFTRPGVTVAAPTTMRTASCISTGVAPAGSMRTNAARPSPAPSVRNRRRSISVLERHEKRHHVLDLLRGQDGLAAIGRGHPCQTLGSMIRRHDRRRIDAARIDDAQAQMALRPSRAGPAQVGRDVALEALVGKRSAVTEQAEPDL